MTEAEARSIARVVNLDLERNGHLYQAVARRGDFGVWRVEVIRRVAT